MPTQRYELPHGGALILRPTSERVGADSLKALSVRAKIQDLLPQYNVVGGFLYQSDFADLVTQAEGVEDIPFAFPPWDAPEEMLAQGFEDWLALPDGNVQDMRAALKGKDKRPLVESGNSESGNS